jgi:hypothetical protein
MFHCTLHSDAPVKTNIKRGRNVKDIPRTSAIEARAEYSPSECPANAQSF